MFNRGLAFEAYNLARKWLTILCAATLPATFFINAPFGRFAPKNGGILVVDGRKAWMVMEMVSPALLIYAFVKAPLALQNPGLPSITSPRGLLAALFLVHYTNRAILSPLRTPSRSKTHIIVTLCGTIFNIMNGFTLGAHLSSPFSVLWFSNPDFTKRIEYKLGLVLWALGFIGNIAHDEILLNIRRRAKAAGKSREQGNDKQKGEHYAIPFGLLYKYISYPNYFCEWIEWFGFALAAAPFPFHITLHSLSFSTVVSALSPLSLFSLVKQIIEEPASNFAPNLSPPWIFFFGEVLTMLPRAYKGHQWYKERFGNAYPKERKAVVPFLL